MIEHWYSELGKLVETLDLEGWFVRVNDHDVGEANIYVFCIPIFRPGIFIWIPPAGISIIVIEALRQACHKRTNSTHVIIVPRLLWNEWQRHMHKSEGLILYIPAGSGYIWPQEMHETVILAIYFTYLKSFL